MVLYFDCTGGISGDMVLHALVALGGNTEAAAGLEIPHEDHSSHQNQDGRSTGIHHHESQGGQRHHDQQHYRKGCAHGQEAVDHHNHSHRSHAAIRQMIDASQMPQTVKDAAKSIYQVIAKAEAQVHGSDVETVHFHEVGRDEAIRNIVGIAAAVESLGIQDIYCSEIHDGTGTIQCSHGKIPVPVPAVMAMRENCDYVFVTEEIETEMVTPSGLGILMGLGAKHAETMPAGKIVKTVVARGKRDTGKAGLKASLIEDR